MVHEWQVVILSWLISLRLTLGLEFVTYSDNGASTCGPVFAPGLWVPSIRPSMVKLKIQSLDASPESPFGYVLYNYDDEDALGVLLPGQDTKSLFCTLQLVGKGGNCTSENVGRLMIVNEKNPPKYKHPIEHGWVNDKGERKNSKDDPHNNATLATYNVKSTGYYCMRLANPNAGSLSVKLQFENPYGQLPPEFYPIFKVSSLLFVLYGAGLVVWLVLSVQHRKHLVSLQNYIGTVIGLFMIEMSVTFAFYYQFNQTGEYSNLLMLTVAIFSATRATASLFFLLLASMGYGIVIAGLGEKARSVYALAIAHLIFSIANALAGVSAQSQSSTTVLLTSLPISITYTIFFSWILNGLASTKDSLALRKQRAKLGMYEQLTLVLFGFFAAACVFMLAAIFMIVTYNQSQDWYAKHWRWLWFFSAGWPMFVNVAACGAISWIFRPQAYNRSYGLNELSEFPLDEEDLDSRANVALDTLRSHSNRRPTSEDGGGAHSKLVVQSSHNINNGERGGEEEHHRWTTGSFTAFGGDDDQSDYGGDGDDNSFGGGSGGGGGGGGGGNVDKNRH